MRETIHAIVLGVAAAGCTLVSPVVHAQTAAPRVVVLWQVGAPLDGWLREEVGKLGYVDGRNNTIDWRVAETGIDSIKALATEVASSRVDIIVTGGTVVTREVLAATKSIPVVFVEQISQFDFVIDLRVANELGIKVPQELLYRADRVIR